MPRSIVWKPRRVILAALLTVVFTAFFFMATVMKVEMGTMAIDDDEIDGASRCFSFADMLRGLAVIDQDDPELVEHVRQKILFYPEYYQTLNSSILNSTLQSSNSSSWVKTRFGQENQSAIVDAFFHGKQDGFFVEAGAFDGEYLSNTMWFERHRNWSGVLVEPNKSAFRQLLVNRRRKNSVAVNTCLSIHKYPESMIFDSADVFGGVIGDDMTPSPDMIDLRSSINDRKFYRVQCLPLYTILLAMGNPVVDYLSLDVEGAEYAVLKTIPFEKVNILTLSVEVSHSNKAIIYKMMKSKGYRLIRRTKSDYIFARRDLDQEQ